MPRTVKLLEGKPYTRKAQQVADFVEHFFQENNGKATNPWPTFRDVTYRCRVSQTQLLEFCDEGIHGLMHTQYNVSPPQLLRDHFVEICK